MVVYRTVSSVSSRRARNRLTSPLEASATNSCTIFAAVFRGSPDPVSAMFLKLSTQACGSLIVSLHVVSRTYGDVRERGSSDHVKRFIHRPRTRTLRLLQYRRPLRPHRLRRPKVSNAAGHYRAVYR